MKNKGNMTSEKANDNSPATKLKDMEYWYLRDRGFKISVMKKFNQLQENSGNLMNWRIKLSNGNSLPKKFKL